MRYTTIAVTCLALGRAALAIPIGTSSAVIVLPRSIQLRQGPEVVPGGLSVQAAVEKAKQAAEAA
ncbi:hypothetical protein AMATHDRAFT_6820 [Amanita thiersii Skay4041]|uniref:Uncharacterized protein n=1 Tax=Amanita thiersii Skay4041 TaxID=703135 RepID=A0A2A9NBA5_9AGAR|nr:hypothetical protein AMATHDRAFT_6820 [Amanita thiersii Skay4041]